MHHVRQENLPFVASSHEFVGAERGDAGVSVFLFHGKPGSGGKPGAGPGPHRHLYGRGKPLPYDEIRFIRGGRGVSSSAQGLQVQTLKPARQDLRGQRGRYLCHQGRGDS